jgi:hypothetical protein
MTRGVVARMAGRREKDGVVKVVSKEEIVLGKCGWDGRLVVRSNWRSQLRTRETARDRDVLNGGVAMRIDWVVYTSKTAQ